MIHGTAAKGYERGAADYEKGRPSYPPDAIDRLVAETGIGERSTVVDVGAGTGKFTRLLVPTGATVIAVEPVDAMRRALAERSPTVRVVEGTADATGLGDGVADVVTVAQAFHWFAHDAALDELARILRPGGWLALIWNTRDVRYEWLARINELMDGLAGDAPRYRSTDPRWHEVLDAHPAFAPTGGAVFANAVPGVDVETMRARVSSTSYVSALPDGERERVLGQVERILRDGPIRSEGPVFTEHYITDLFWYRRR